MAAASVASTTVPLDHLAPDELAPSKTEVYGFPVPRGMEVESRLVDRAYVSGRVSPEGLANYVREQVVVSHVEIGAARTVFPMAASAPPNRRSASRVPMITTGLVPAASSPSSNSRPAAGFTPSARNTLGETRAPEIISAWSAVAIVKPHAL